ncbi:Selenocysteine-specific elongation factor [Phycisphaerae bacterium RAS1]|nr:Selenocysteine-specific elongation factor [Phycisphaerae bacterium RAS1]
MLPAQLVVGTAGHIDHGKSRLVLALTGVDPDRLPEEKARGMTIDLGFAHASINGADIHFVDVPGHERFIRNMVAGATGIDVALLVVAADDSIMPQTREHAEVLSLLGIQRCLIVLTKMDLVDAAWADAVEQETRDLLGNVGIEPLGCIRTSAETGAGLDALRAKLADLASTRNQSQLVPEWFRMPIDRAFNVAGRGVVVTGTVYHGAVARDDELELWPAGARVRTRDLQSHNDPRAAAAGRMRLAVNLAGVSLADVRRGCELATPGYLCATQRLDACIAALRTPGKPGRTRLRLRLHIATSDVLATLRWLEPPPETPQGGRFAQLTTEEPIVAAWGQRFILRDESASRTLGGGWVLRPAAPGYSTREPPSRDALLTLKDAAPRQRLEEVIRAAGWNAPDPPLLASQAGLASAAEAQRARQALADAQVVVRIDEASQQMHIHASHLKQTAETLAARLRAHLSANPRLAGVAHGEWPQWMPRACPPRMRPALAGWLIAQEYFVETNGFVTPAGERIELPPEDRALLEQVLAEYAQSAFQPPEVDALKCRTSRTARRLTQLIALAVARKKLVRVAEGIFLHADRWAEATQRVAALIRTRGGVTVSDVRTLLNSSRKFIVPLVELLDASGITRRVGDQRLLGPKAPQA